MLLKQATHIASFTRHRGALAGQSLFIAHSTHCLVMVEQTGRVAGQSLAALQPTQAPLVESHMGVSWGQLAFEVHAAWQV
jgi:hypothetical protein